MSAEPRPEIKTTQRYTNANTELSFLANASNGLVIIVH
jgi:hypothetical protein